MASVRGAVACSVECGKGGLPIRFVISADALQGFEHHLPSAVVVALQASELPGKSLRGKGLAGGLRFRFGRLCAAQGNMPAISAQYDPA